MMKPLLPTPRIDDFVAGIARKAEQPDHERFFHQPYAEMKVLHWSKMSYWTVDECVALSFGKEPRIVTWPRVQAELPHSKFAQDFADRREILLRAQQSGQLFVSTIPGVFLAWAKRMQIPVPDALLEAVEALGTQVRDWKSAFEEQEAIAAAAVAELKVCKEERIRAIHENTKYIEKSGQEHGKIIEGYKSICEKYTYEIENLRKQVQALEEQVRLSVNQEKHADRHLGTRERNSLLKLVIGMAVQGYKYNTNGSRSPVTREIAADLDILGIGMDEDTVRKYLAEAKDLLPPTETE